MKKLILILPLFFLLTGCSDYKEVNELAIVSAIGIDYDDLTKEYIVTLETFNNKVEKESSKVTTYTRTGKDKAISVAIEKAADKLSARAYYSHIKLCVLSLNVAQEHFEEICDFILRSTYLRENFQVVTSKIAPEEVLKIESDENPISSIALNLLLQTNAYASNYARDLAFDVFLKEIIEFGSDGAMSVINVENNNFYIDGLAIFNNYNLVNILSNEEASIYNILQNKIKKTVLSLEFNGKNVSIALYDITSKIKVTKNNITVDGTYKAKLMEDTPGFDIKDEKVLDALDQEFSKYLNKEITNFIKTCQKNKSDILYLGKNYYINTRDKNESLWQNLSIKSQVKVVINKKGLIFNIYENK